MMTPPVAGIDPHQDSFTVGIVDANGVELDPRVVPDDAPPATSTAIELLTAHGVVRVGIEGSASWGAHVAIALVAAGFDCSRSPTATVGGAASGSSAGQDRRRRRRRHGAGVAGRTDARTRCRRSRCMTRWSPRSKPCSSTVACWSRSARWSFTTSRTRSSKLPIEIRDQLSTTGKIESRLRRLEQIDTTIVSTIAGEYRLSWLIPLVDQDRAARRQIRQLERDLDRAGASPGRAARSWSMSGINHDSRYAPAIVDTIVVSICSRRRSRDSILPVALRWSRISVGSFEI